MRRREAAAEEIDRLPRRGFGAISRHHDERAGAIGDETAIAHGEGVAHHARGAHLGNGQGLAHEGVGVERGPAARRHRDLGELLDRRAVLVDVSRGRQRIGGDRNIALIDLAEGARLMSRVEGMPPDQVRIGMAVKARIAKTDGGPLLVFDPA